MSNFKPTFLYIKRHKITGKLYFGKTIKRDVEKYNGSGTYWMNHIKKHGIEHVETLWYCLFLEKDVLIEFATKFSTDNNIVASSDWLNQIPETGLSSDMTYLKEINKGMVSAKDEFNNNIKVTKEEFDSRDDLKGVISDREDIHKKISEMRSGYISAKDKYGNNMIVTKEEFDSRDDLMGIMKGIPAHPNTIAASRARKGIPKTKEHKQKNSEAMKKLKWYHNFDTNITGRFKENEQPTGFIRIIGPHKKLTIEEYNEEIIKKRIDREERRKNNKPIISKNCSEAQLKFHSDNPLFKLSDDNIKFIIKILKKFEEQPKVPEKNLAGKRISYIRSFSKVYSQIESVSFHTVYSILSGQKNRVIIKLKEMYPELIDVVNKIISINSGNL